jgi:hypothetical protein
MQLNLLRCIYEEKLLPLSQVYKFLEPGPVVLVSTPDKGNNNRLKLPSKMK